MDKNAPIGLITALELAGSQAELARRLREQGKAVKQQHIWNWLNRDKKVPPDMAKPICAAFNGLIAPHDLCPDLYPPEFHFEYAAGKKAAA